MMLSPVYRSYTCLSAGFLAMVVEAAVVSYQPHAKEPGLHRHFDGMQCVRACKCVPQVVDDLCTGSQCRLVSVKRPSFAGWMVFEHKWARDYKCNRLLCFMSHAAGFPCHVLYTAFCTLFQSFCKAQSHLTRTARLIYGQKTYWTGYAYRDTGCPLKQ